MLYPDDYEVKRVSQSGHISHQGKSQFYMSEIFAGCHVGLFENQQAITELHYANLHLGNLEFNCLDPWRPDSIIVKPDQAPKSSRARSKQNKIKRK